jgi:hypothetical protein
MSCSRSSRGRTSRVVLDLLQVLVELREGRQERVDERVREPIEQLRGAPGRLVDAVVALVEPVDSGRRVVAEGDDQSLRRVHVHLDEAVVVGRVTEEDEEGEVAVVVELRPLVELHRVLDGEGVEAERPADRLDVVG